jgi:hypothetical protein
MKVPGSNLGEETIKHVCIMKVLGSDLGQETVIHECVSYWFLNLLINFCIIKLPGSNLGQETLCSGWHCYVCVNCEQVLGLCLSISYIYV